MAAVHGLPAADAAGDVDGVEDGCLAGDGVLVAQPYAGKEPRL